MKIGKKTAVTRELTRQEKNRRNNIKRLTVALIVAFIVFIALIVIQSNILNQEEKKPVYQVVKDIPTGTKIAEDNINTYLQVREIQISLIPEGYITDSSTILGKFTNRDYKAKDVITSDGLTDTEKMYKDNIENPTELSFSVGETAAAVSGTIHEGDFVNIYGLRKDAITDSKLASYSDELMLTDEYFTFMHVYIAEAYNGDGARIGTDDATGQKAVMFTIILSENDVKTFNEMLKNCDIRLAKILYDSDKSYTDFIEEVNVDAAKFKSQSSGGAGSTLNDSALDEDKTYFWDIDVNTGKYPEEGTTEVHDYSEETIQQLEEEAAQEIENSENSEENGEESEESNEKSEENSEDNQEEEPILHENAEEEPVENQGE